MKVFTAHPARSRFPFALLLVSLFGTAAGMGCQDQHIGRKCDLGTSVDAGATTLISNTGALECPSRICILPSQERSTNTGPLCTAECTSDDDCSGGELRVDSDSTDHRCKGGFACRRLLPGISNNELACKRLCVCKDFLKTGDTGTGNNENCNGDSPAK